MVREAGFPIRYVRHLTDTTISAEFADGLM